MRVTILCPPISTKERYGSSLMGYSGGKSIPLGIYYLASAVRQDNHIVQVFDAETENLTTDECVYRINEFKPDIIGISSTTAAFHRALEIASNLYNQGYTYTPPPKIIIGGAHVSASPEHALSFKCFFAGVIGEGEETFIEILRCIEKKRDWTNIDGIAYMDSLGNLIRTKPRKLIDNLDLIPFPAYDLIPNMFAYTPQAYNYKKTPVANIMTSRGCPNQCTFCDRTIFGQKLRQRSPDNVAQEISLLYHKYAIKEFAFADDTFTINFDRVIKLFDILEKDNISFPWTCMSRVNTVTKESIKQMKKLGCWMLSFGIESGVEDILKTIKKNITLEQIHQALLWCKEEGIKSAGFFMIGHPQETLETINKTIAFALKLPLNVVSVTINTPYPGSAQHQDVNKYGLLDSTDWSLYSHWRPVFIPFGLDKETLVNKQKEFYRRFYLRPAIIFSFMLTFFKSGGFKRFFQLVKSVPYILFK